MGDFFVLVVLLPGILLPLIGLFITVISFSGAISMKRKTTETIHTMFCFTAIFWFILWGIIYFIQG